MAKEDPVHNARARLAAYTRFGNEEKAYEARIDLKAAHLERAIYDALLTAPPLTEIQRTRLATLLTGGAR